MSLERTSPEGFDVHVCRVMESLGGVCQPSLMIDHNLVASDAVHQLLVILEAACRILTKRIGSVTTDFHLVADNRAPARGGEFCSAGR